MAVAPRSRLPVLWPLVEESLEEADFLWQRWEAAFDAHDVSFADLATWTEDRLLGALDGVRVGGRAAVERLLAAELTAGESPAALPAGARVAAAAHLLLTGGIPEGLSIVVAAFLTATGGRLAALRRAAELAGAAALDEVAARVRQASPEVVAAIIDGCSFQQRGWAGDLRAVGATGEVHLLRAVARACRYAPEPQRGRLLGHALACDDPTARALAVESGVILGEPAAWSACLALAPGDGRLLELLALRGKPGDADLVLRALGRGDGPGRREAVPALGWVGTQEAADACVELLGQGIEPRLAGEAFSTITGLELSPPMVVPPADEEMPETEDLDASLVPGADELLPLPEPKAVARWWQGQRSRFAPGARYLGGRLASPAVLREALLAGPNRRRHGLARGLALTTSGRAQVETRAWTGEQRRQMARAFAEG